jgi:hypothetical protein
MLNLVRQGVVGQLAKLIIDQPRYLSSCHTLRGDVESRMMLDKDKFLSDILLIIKFWMA